MLRFLVVICVVGFTSIARADTLTFPSAVTTGCLPRTATLTLTTAAGAGGRTFSLSTTAGLSAPATVTVPEGATVATINVTTSYVASNTVTTLTATEGGTTLTRNLTLRANAPVSQTVTSTLGPNQSGSGAFTLACPSEPGGTTVSLTSSSANLTVDATATVAEGDTLGTFAFSAGDFSAAETVTLTSTRGGVSRASTVRLKQPTIRSFTFSSTIPTGGASVNGLVTLDVPAGAGGVVVDVSSANPSVASPDVASITIPTGETEGSFPISTVVVDTQTAVVFTATANSVAKTATLTVRRNRIENIRASQLVVSVCRGIEGEVKLLAPAGASGSTVTLGTDRPDLLTFSPTTLTFLEGEQRATFSVATTAAPSAPTTAVVQADFNGLVEPMNVTVIRTSAIGCL